MGGNDVIGHVKSFPRTFRRGAVHSFAAAQRRQCTLVAFPQLPSYDDRQPQGKEPKLSDLGVTRRNPDIVRDSEGPSGTAARALFRCTIFAPQSGSEFSDLQLNSLRNGTGNFWRPNLIEGSGKLRTLNSDASQRIAPEASTFCITRGTARFIQGS